MTTKSRKPQHVTDHAGNDHNGGAEDVFETPSIALSVAGRDLIVTPITLGEMPSFSRAARPVFEFMRDMEVADGNNSLFDLFEMHTQELAALVAVGARVDVGWLLAMTLEDAARVGDAVLKLNQDFFIRRLLPLIRMASNTGANPTGAMPSSGLSGQASDSPK